MKIPSQFKILGKIITVKYDKNIAYKDDVSGYASYRTNEIILQPVCGGVECSQTNVEIAFMHELIHHICYHAGAAINHKLDQGNYLHQNEEFVDLFAGILHQALTSMEFDS